MTYGISIFIKQPHGNAVPNTSIEFIILSSAMPLLTPPVRPCVHFGPGFQTTQFAFLLQLYPWQKKLLLVLTQDKAVDLTDNGGCVLGIKTKNN